jgi:hypothetical protein
LENQAISNLNKQVEKQCKEHWTKWIFAFLDALSIGNTGSPSGMHGPHLQIQSTSAGKILGK